MALQAAFDHWLDSALPPSLPAEVEAFNFNIAETSDGFLVEVIGAPGYDPVDDDWAADGTWSSHPGYFSISHESIGKDWKTALQTVTDLVREYIRNENNSRARILRRARAVTAGFVDGDLLKVWPREIA